jgi:catechol 2,3-dioxygenase-like lactoylglutathione lyase family enzyme
MIRHVSGVAEIVENVPAAVDYYRNVLGLTVEYKPDEPYAVVKVPGVLHFGIWARASAAERMYGSSDQAARVPLGFHIEFEVNAVADAAQAIGSKGVAIAQGRVEEPWGQVTARYFSPTSGALVGLSETPWCRELPRDSGC